MHHRQDQRRRQRGALLVEALISFSLFLVASVAFLGLAAHSRRAETKARQILAANAYARELMESRRLKGFAALVPGTEKGTKDFASDRDGVGGTTRMNYGVTVYEGPGTGVRSIVVTMTWSQGRVEVESYVTQ